MTPDDQARVDEIRAQWLQHCGFCDDGLPMMCTCPIDDHRNVIEWLLDRLAGETERADHNAAAVNANADMIVALRIEEYRSAPSGTASATPA